MIYTHIVVGAGSAGCVLAEGLSANARNRVLLVEAGPDYAGDRLPPELRDGTTPAIGSHDWGLWACTQNGQRMHLPRGRVVGGTSQVNSCIALRPEPSDFHGLASGALPSWDWKRMAECMLEVEDDLDFAQPDGARGPVQIRRSRTAELAFPSRALIDACRAAGHPYIENHNAPFTTGVGPAPLNSLDGQRISARSAYLQPARGRSNLDVLGGAVVDRVLIVNGRTEGIEYRSQGCPEERHVLGETVVLAAGAYGTPVILQRSGLGPQTLLERLGIPVVADLPGVGANLSDHSQVPVPFMYDRIEDAERVPCVQVLLRYSSREPAGRRNDMQLCMINHVSLAGYSAALASAWDSAVASALTSNLMLPVTRGRVRLAEPGDAAETLIEYRFVGHRADLARHREGVRAACAMLLDEPFGARITRLHRPTDEQLADNDALNAWILENMQPGHHPVGTARMGRVDDPRTVVGDDLAVRGVSGLYAADASVLPEPIRANTNLTVLAVARNALRIFRARQPCSRMEDTCRTSWR